MLVGIGLVYLLLPLVIFFALPLVVIGAFVALAVTGRTLDLSALIGLLMLHDIVVTNGIVLPEIEAGADVRTALVQSGRTHVRPILKTAVATILALIPLALSSDEGLVAASLATVAIIRAPACPARQRELDSAAAVIYLGRYYTGLALEDFLAALATPVHGSVLSNLKRHRPPTHHRLSFYLYLHDSPDSRAP